MLVMPAILMAQPGPVDLCPDPQYPDCPIDSGTVILIVTVIAVAFLKTYKKINTLKINMV